MRVLTVIPARIGSSRLPQKPLRSICGEPLIRIVARRAIELAVADEVIVAADDQRVLEALRGLRVRGLLTRPDHRSGTERIGEIVRKPEFADSRLVLNLQVDQPFLPAAAARGALQLVRSGYSVGTAAAPLQRGALDNRCVVKVTLETSGRALDFSRDPPDTRDPLVTRDPPVTHDAGSSPRRMFHHLGVYAYHRDTILEWISLPECTSERIHDLEQLRPLQAGMSIGVALCKCAPPPAVDTEHDLRRARMVHVRMDPPTRKSA